MPWEGKNLPFTTGNTVSYWIESQIHHRHHSYISKYLLRRQVLRLEPEIGISVVSPHSQCATALHFDQVERRFLLSGGKQGSIAIHDFEKASPLSTNALSNSLEPKKLSAVRSAPLAANDFHSISTVQWYPADSGIFLAGNLGGRFCLFDTNAFAPVFSLHFRNRKIFSAKFHNNFSHSTLHSCIALGLDQGETLLVDPRVGDRPIAHLQTHARGSAVNSVEWHTAIGGFDYQLLTAGDDGAVRLWDTRSLASVSSTQRTPLLSLDWTNDHTFSSSSRQNMLQQQNLFIKQQRLQQTQNTVASQAASVTAHAGAKVKRALFTPCGRHILSVGDDTAMRLWQASSGRHLTQFHYELPSRGLASAGPINFPLVLWPQPQTEELLCVLPVSQSTKSRTSTARNTPAYANNTTVAIYPVYGASGRPVRFLQSGHLQGPITDIAINCNSKSSLCGIKDAAMVTSAADGLILLWEAPFGENSANDDVELDEDNEQDKKGADTYGAHVSVRSSARRIESRYEFERDVLQRHFSHSESNRVNNNSSSNTISNDTVVVINNNNSNGNSHNTNEKYSSDNNISTTAAADVQVYQLESCNTRFLPSILRTYLQQARFHIERISNDPPHYRHGRHNTNDSNNEVSNEQETKIDWNEVDAILRNTSDEEDSSEEIRPPGKTRRIMTKNTVVDTVASMGTENGKYIVGTDSHDSKSAEMISENNKAPTEFTPHVDLFGGISDSDSDEGSIISAYQQDNHDATNKCDNKVVECVAVEKQCDTPSSLAIVDHINISSNINNSNSKSNHNNKSNINSDSSNSTRKRKSSNDPASAVSKEAAKRMQRLRKK